MSDVDAGGQALRYFEAFEAADRPTLEKLLADDFSFTSPFDDAIDHAAWFARCFPFAGSFRFRRPMQVFGGPLEAVILYETEGKPGGTFRNAERFRIHPDGKIRSIEVYFGFLPKA